VARRHGAVGKVALLDAVESTDRFLRERRAVVTWHKEISR
jgi:hypothetical protein